MISSVDRNNLNKKIMNIEQEFKEIKQLLLDSYKADYEDTLNQAIDKLDKLDEAINYTHCSLQLPDNLEPVLAKIEHVNDLGKSSWYEVVYNDENWRSYKGSNTFEDGEKVVKWKYCKAIV
jgi:formate dehydrogenase maturation protein FdhE